MTGEEEVVCGSTALAYFGREQGREGESDSKRTA